MNIEFVTGLPHSRRQHDSIWVIVDRLTKSSHFLPVHTSNTTEDYAKLCIRELVRLHGVTLSITQIGVLSLPLTLQKMGQIVGVYLRGLF